MADLGATDAEFAETLDSAPYMGGRLAMTSVRCGFDVKETLGAPRPDRSRARTNGWPEVGRLTPTSSVSARLVSTAFGAPAMLAAMTPAADDSARLPRVKVVGRRRLRHADWDDARRLLHTVAVLRPVAGLCPRGVYRFGSFEEAERWLNQTIARTLARRPSKTSSESAGH